MSCKRLSINFGRKEEWGGEGRATNLGDHSSLDPSRIRNVWAHAEIDHWSAAIDRRAGSVGDFGVDEVDFVLVVLFRVIGE